MLFVFFLLFLTFVPLVGQAFAVEMIGIENGVVFGYNLGTNGLGIGHEFGIRLNLTEAMQVGFVYITGDGANMNTFTLLKIEYTVMPLLGVTMASGMTNNNLAVGIGVFSNILTNTVANRVITVLRIKFEYLYDATTSLDNGIIAASLTARIGL